MNTPKPPRFFTWLDEPVAQQADVPLRMRVQLRVLWLNGAKVEDLAKTFNLPIAWVDDFVRQDPGETQLQ